MKKFAFALRLENGPGDQLLIHSDELKYQDALFLHEESKMAVEVVETPLADGARSWQVKLTNQGAAARTLDFFAPLLMGLAAQSTAYVPQCSGAVMVVKDADYIVHSLGQLTSLFAILHDETSQRGLIITQEKSSEDEERYRTGLMVHGKGIPCSTPAKKVQGVAGSIVDTTQQGVASRDLGGFAAFVESLVLAPGATMQVGPYILAEYDGTWMQGAEKIRKLRRPRAYKPWPAWLKPVRTATGSCMWHQTIEKFSDYPRYAEMGLGIGAPVNIPIQWNDLPRRDPSFWWAYSLHTKTDPHFGTDQELRQAIVDARKRGVRSVLYSSFCTIGADGPHAEMFRENNWYQLCEPGRTDPVIQYGPLGNFYSPCVGLPQVRQWIVDGLVQLMEKYEPDGLFLDETAAIGYRPCYNPAHHHEHPFVWAWGNYQILRQFRSILEKRWPDAVVLLEGASELLRECVDGYACHSHSFTGFRCTEPVTRAVVDDNAGIFDSFSNGTSIDKAAARNFAFGARYFGDITHQDILHRQQPYRTAYPEMMEGRLMPVRPELSVRQQPGHTMTLPLGYLFEHHGKVVMTLANPHSEVAENFVDVKLPIAAKHLYDRVTTQFISLTDNAARLRLGPWGVKAFEVIR